MNTTEDHENEPPILPNRIIPADWQRFITDFLGGNINMHQKGALREKINSNPEFLAYVSGLAATEARLATLLAESKYQQADPKEPPTWALERLRGAVAQINRHGTMHEGGLVRLLSWIQDLTGIRRKTRSKDIYKSDETILGAAMPRMSYHTTRKPERMSWFTLPRLIFAGSAVALLAVFVIVLPRLGNQSNEMMANSPEIKELLNLSPEVFVASVGSPNMVRSTGRFIYSPSGVTSQADPIVLLSPDVKLRDTKIEVSAPGKPELTPLQGYYHGVPQTLSKILQKGPGLQASAVYQIRLIAKGEIVYEETFRVSDHPDLEIPQSPSALLLAALGAVNDMPPRPGDALSFLALLPKKYQDDQAVIRVRYMALVKLGELEGGSALKSKIR